MQSAAASVPVTVTGRPRLRNESRGCFVVLGVSRGRRVSYRTGTTLDVDLTAEQLAAVRAVSAPGMTEGGGARRFPYDREPYGRATIPTALGAVTVDGKVLRTERGPLVEFWRDCTPLGVLDVFIPAAWVEPITRGESSWVHPYDVTDDE